MSRPATVQAVAVGSVAKAVAAGLAALALGASPARAQTATVAPEVTRSTDVAPEVTPLTVEARPFFPGIRGRLMTPAGLPVQAARVATDDGLFETFSLADGTFWLEGVPPGEIHLAVEAEGFETLNHGLQLLPEMAPDLKFTLKAGKTNRRSARNDGVTVKGKRKATGMTRYTLERETLRKVAGTFGDPLRAIQNLPGVNRAPYALGLLLVRGTGPNDSSVFIDGHEVPLLYHFFAGPSVLAPDMLDRIDFLPGNFSARYGRAIGGVLDVTTRRGDSDHWSGSADVDFFDAGLFAQGPLGEDTQLAIAGRRSYIDAVIRSATSAAGEEDAALLLPVYWDYQARVDHRLSKAHRLTALFFGSEDHFSLVGDPGGNGPSGGAEGRVGFHRLMTTWDANLGGGTTLNVAPVVGFDVSTLDADEIQIEALVWEYALRAELNLRPLDTVTVRTGLDSLGRFATLTATIPFRVPNYRSFPGAGFLDNEPQTIKRDVSIHNLAAYGEATWAPGDTGFSVTPGLRLDTFTASAGTRVMLDPRLNVRQALTPIVALKAGAGLFSQPPTEFRLDRELGNPDLGPEWADQYAFGLDVETGDDTTLSTEVYLSRRHDLVEPVTDVQITASGPDPTRFDNVGEGRSYGFEVMLRREDTPERSETGTAGWIAYSLSRAEEKEGPDEPWQRVRSDQTHHLIAVWSIRLPSHISVGTRLQLVSGSPLETYDGAVFNSDRSNYEPIQVPDDGMSHQSLFHEIDIRVDKTWVGQVFNVTAYVDLINLENAYNPELLQWDYRYREFAFVRGLPILPSFGVQLVMK